MSLKRDGERKEGRQRKRERERITSQRKEWKGSQAGGKNGKKRSGRISRIAKRGEKEAGDGKGEERERNKSWMREGKKSRDLRGTREGRKTRRRGREGKDTRDGRGGECRREEANEKRNGKSGKVRQYAKERGVNRRVNGRRRQKRKENGSVEKL